ncbi:MAG: peptide chain release factor N(5)-glutamine methyltransferase [Deltaproteobacteria bacterium]|jgi:release factor glutamine methyltransferase|nr:peptide chain release factor N(5)-glutamine methyltransferase [Deltaproteobacteria bacterium]MBW2532871.1 peptide chain release factor N(5)-glutamine methyltransferase [Deltaproteobacteria bacterium]
MTAPDPAPWTIERVLRWATDDLRKRGSSSPRLDAELLLGHVLGSTRVEMVIDAQRPLSPDELGGYRKLHQRRRRGEPVAYLRGTREFYGRPFVVDPRVLIPRPETELLVQVALQRTAHLRLSARVLDLCTGSGCVAITLARERPTTVVRGSDVSGDALEVARDNALRLGAQIGLLQSDCYDGLDRLRGRLDLITANPPYIPDAEMEELPPDIREFEPRLALAAGDGFDVVRRLVDGAPDMLAPGGVLAVEVGAGQAPRARRLFEQAGLDEIRASRDYGGHERVISGRVPT